MGEGKAKVADLTGQASTTPLMHLFSSQPRTLFDLLEVRALPGAGAYPAIAQ